MVRGIYCNPSGTNSNLLIPFSHDHIEVVVNTAGEYLFFKQRDGPYFPSLKLLHKCKRTVSIVFLLDWSNILSS